MGGYAGEVMLIDAFPLLLSQGVALQQPCCRAPIRGRGLENDGWGFDLPGGFRFHHLGRKSLILVEPAMEGCLMDAAIDGRGFPGRGRAERLKDARACLFLVNRAAGHALSSSNGPHYVPEERRRARTGAGNFPRFAIIMRTGRERQRTAHGFVKGHRVRKSETTGALSG
jgi:hypothetical protein